MRQVQHLEAAGQALGQPALHQQRRRAEQHHLERHARRRVSSSQRRFTVSDQPGIFWISSSTSTAPVPALARSQARASHCCASQARSRRAGSSAVADAPAGLLGLSDLLHQRGLADLARAGHHLQEAPRLAQPGGEDGGLGAQERASTIYAVC